MATAKKTAKKTVGKANGAARREERAPNVQRPEGLKTRKLSNGIRPAGFLVVPTLDDPKPTTFCGVLRALGSKPNPRTGKDSVWGVFEAVGNQKSEAYDNETGEMLPVTDGLLVGVSKKGALHGMTDDKIGYWFGLEYTGHQIDLGKGKSAMWEVLAEVSEEPFER